MERLMPCNYSYGSVNGQKNLTTCGKTLHKFRSTMVKDMFGGLKGCEVARLLWSGGEAGIRKLGSQGCDRS